MQLAAVILAAGKGTRMKSRLPKVLHKVCGKPMILHVISAVEGAGSQKVILVVGFGGDLVKSCAGADTQVVYQHQQLGTAHALLQAREDLAGFEGDILVVCGDTPLVTRETLNSLVSHHVSTRARATVLTTCLDDPGSYGRVIRDQNKNVLGIVEKRDATPEELLVKEINTGIYCFKSRGLFDALEGIKPDNAQGEYYLTDIIEFFVSQGDKVSGLVCPNQVEVMGINDRVQLCEAQSIMSGRLLNQLMVSGVTVQDMSSVYVESGVHIGQDTVLLPGTYIGAGSNIGDNCILGPGAHIVSSTLGSDIIVRYSLIEGSFIGDGCNIGPYSYIRPGCKLGKQVKVGDFVELKKTDIGSGSKVPHLSYVGDATLGEKVNIGAGTITCNYDGVNKWPTIIGDGAFIGSNTNLVAPVNIGQGAVTGAGSTITKDVPSGALGVARGKQINIPNWPLGKKKDRE